MSAWWVRLPPVFLAAVLLHTTLLAQLRVAGVAAELMLLLAVGAGIVAGPQRGAIVGFAAGLVADVFLLTPFGLSAFVYSITGYTVGVVQFGVLRLSWWIPLLTAVVASAAAVAGFALVGAVVGQAHLVGVRLLVIAGIVAALNGVLSVPTVRALRWAIDAHDRGRPA